MLIRFYYGVISLSFHISYLWSGGNSLILTSRAVSNSVAPYPHLVFICTNLAFIST